MTTTPASRPAWLLLYALVAAVAIAGALDAWFLCDDAYITFRYVGNLYDGHGPVWNPAPFLPVEGYTSPLWVVVLWLSWSLSGMPPPQTANWLSLLCGLGTLWLCQRWLLRLPLPPRAERWRWWLAALTLLGIATNRTFVTWLSSGMETAMFGLFAVGWTLRAARPDGQSRPWHLLALSGLAGAAMLTRPDGTLLALATVAIAGHRWWRHDETAGGILAGLSPLALPAAHLLWRRSYYGEWLPNTYYAKVVSAWPESGLRYLFCFAVEHGVLPWLALVVLWLSIQLLRGGARTLTGPAFSGAVVAATWIGFVGYYTLVVGGDHFEYRPFAHLVPLLFLTTVAMLRDLRCAPWLMAALLLGLLAVANPFGWWHDRALQGREAAAIVRTSERVPTALRPLFREYDRCQAWLRLRFVGLRRSLHAGFCRRLERLLPERGAAAAMLPTDRRAVVITVNAGVLSWRLPEAIVLDACGLNDWVIARNHDRIAPPALSAEAIAAAFATFDADHDQRLRAAEIEAAAAATNVDGLGLGLPHGEWAAVLTAACDRDDDGLDLAEFAAAVAMIQSRRHMAHDRDPPPGYLQAFRANLYLDNSGLRTLDSEAPLRDDEIRAIEQQWRRQFGR